MATVYVIGHGIWNFKSAGKPWASVPRDTSISFYTDNLHNLFFVNGLRIYELGGIVGSQEGDTHTYGMSPANYQIQALTETQKEWYELLDSGGAIPKFIGYDLPDNINLCNGTPETCDDAGNHDCDGLFAHPDVVGNDIVWLACQGVELDNAFKKVLADGQVIQDLQAYIAAGIDPSEIANTTQEGVGTGTDTNTEDMTWAREAHAYFETAATADWEAYFFDQMADLERSQIRTYGDVEAWYQQWKIDNPNDQRNPDYVEPAAGGEAEAAEGEDEQEATR